MSLPFSTDSKTCFESTGKNQSYMKRIEGEREVVTKKKKITVESKKKRKERKMRGGSKRSGMSDR